MSWRGVKKSISRLPHQFKTRNGSEEVTKDAEYHDLEKQYKEVVKNGDELRVDILSYRDNLANLLNYQSLASNHLAELCGVQPSEDDLSHDDYKENIRPELKQALEDYAVAMSYCNHESFALLDDLDATVLRPLDDFQVITKAINKTMTKRDHKLIDYDRFRVSYFKYSAISDPSPSEEKNMFKLQTQYDNAAYDYEYFNNMLKEELAVFLELAQQLIEPIMQNFYTIQTRAMGGIYGRIHEVLQHNGPSFPTLDLPIEKGFELRLSQRNVREELDASELFGKVHKPWERRVPSFSNNRRLSEKDDSLSVNVEGYPPMYKTMSNQSNTSSISSDTSSRYSYGVGGKSAPPPVAARPSFLNTNTTRSRSLSSPNVPPPIRRPSFTPSVQQSNVNTPPMRASYLRRNTVSESVHEDIVQKKKRAPPPPPPSKKFSSINNKKEYVEALYELKAPQEGDLSFRAGDLIEVLEKSEKTEDWWKGRLGDQTGMFPANYVKPV